VYNMQLSNPPAEELADVLVRSGNGAFAACSFVSGGMRPSHTLCPTHLTHTRAQARRQWKPPSSSRGRYLPPPSSPARALSGGAQYFFETGQPKRAHFIARQLSYHGNTLGTLSLAYHPVRRAPYAAILDDRAFHHVSPAYAARFLRAGESEEQYVERLRDELDAKFEELGGDTVIACACPARVRGVRLMRVRQLWRRR
jgi:hypothetical protein